MDYHREEFDQEHMWALAIIKYDEIEEDAKRKGPLWEYVHVCKRKAVRAVGMLTEVDPKDTEQIVGLQAIVAQYREVLEYVRRTLSEGEEAMQQMDLTEPTPDAVPNMEGGPYAQD